MRLLAISARLATLCLARAASSRPTAMAGKQWYAVAQGRRPGLYRTWDECRAQVQPSGEQQRRRPSMPAVCVPARGCLPFNSLVPLSAPGPRLPGQPLQGLQVGVGGGAVPGRPRHRGAAPTCCPHQPPRGARTGTGTSSRSGGGGCAPRSSSSGGSSRGCRRQAAAAQAWAAARLWQSGGSGGGRGGGSSGGRGSSKRSRRSSTSHRPHLPRGELGSDCAGVPRFCVCLACALFAAPWLRLPSLEPPHLCCHPRRSLTAHPRATRGRRAWARCCTTTPPGWRCAGGWWVGWWCGGQSARW